ncbi:MAG: OsmC family protein [bacterium]|jgi:putative redox protein|nr:OsmC family protein [bacterium]
MKVSLNYVSDKEFETENESGNKLMIDMLDPESKNHQSPTQLLLSAIAACAAVDIVSMVKKKRKTFVNLEAEIEGTRAENHPRKFTEIHVKYILTSPDMTNEDFNKVVSLAVENYCSVASTVNESTKLTHTGEVKAS